jgi:hypothetical protein
MKTEFLTKCHSCLNLHSVPYLLGQIPLEYLDFDMVAPRGQKLIAKSHIRSRPIP